VKQPNWKESGRLGDKIVSVHAKVIRFEPELTVHLQEVPPGQGWLIYNTHGLHHEGWGPLRSIYLENLLDQIAKIEKVHILPTKRAIN